MIYAAFRGKNEYSSDKIGEKKFFCNMNRCWATVQWCIWLIPVVYQLVPVVYWIGASGVLIGTSVVFYWVYLIEGRGVFDCY